ncbi:MAG: gamma-glutamylcyclotransferase [Actinobacteria bacterium]|nr:gamma-glutamylcyclotransferase [Actinomycetota bacterium]
MYYFAYGSNINKNIMESKCPDARPLKGPFFLENVRFVYDGESALWDDKAVANLVSIEGCTVWGVLYQIDKKDLENLDHLEEFPEKYGRSIVTVKDTEENRYSAWVYHRVGQKKGEPSAKYREVILEGACNYELPAEYVELYLK